MDGSIRALHVDDDPAFADLTAEMLETKGDRISVETVSSAREGLELLDSGGIDCVVSDYDMPGMDGIEFLETVREGHPELPFFLFTGKGSEAVAAEAVEAGVTGYIQKSGTDTFDLLASRIRSEVEDHRITTSYRQYKTVIDSLTDPVYAVDENGVFVDVNTAFLDLVGYDESTVVGSHASMSKTPESIERVEAHIREALSTEGPNEALLEVDIVTADGDVVPCEDHIGVIESEDGRFDGSVGVLRDVSDRERNEAYRRELYDVSSRMDLDTETRCRRMLELGRQRLDVADAKLVRIDAESGTHETIIAASDEGVEGEVADLSETYCRRVVDTGDPVAFHDAEVAGWSDDPTYEEYGHACYVGAEVAIEDEPYGTICFVDEDPRRLSFSDAELTFVDLIGRAIERDLERGRAEEDLERRKEAIEEIHGIVSERDRSHEERIRRLLGLCRETLGAEYGVMSRVRDGEYRFEILDATGDAIEEGDELPLAETGCERTVAEAETKAAARLGEDPRYEDQPIHTKHGQECYIGTPIYRGGKLYGTVCFTAETERERAFSEWERVLVELTGQWVGYTIQQRADRKALART